MRYAALGSALLSIATVADFDFQARNRQRPPAISLPLAAAVGLVALAVLLPRYGIVGAGLALLIAGVVACVMLLIWFVHAFGWQLRWSNLLRFLAAGATLVAVLLLLPHDSDVWTFVTVYAWRWQRMPWRWRWCRLLQPSNLRVLSGGLPVERLGYLPGVVFTITCKR